MCNNTVDQTVPCGPFGASCKIVTLRCGSTSIYGSPLYCEECLKAGAVSRPAWTYEDAGDEDFEPYQPEYDAEGYEV